MRVAIFNDTSGNHYGCDAVMAALFANIKARGGSVMYCHPVAKPWRNDRDTLSLIDAADAIIVNGEGTIHHDQDRALLLTELGSYAFERGGCPPI